MNPGSRWIPTIPRDPAERLRLLSFWFLLIAGFIEIFALLASRLTPAPLRVVAVIADVALIGWFALGHRRGKLPEFSAPFEATLLVFIGGASSLPLRSMGMFLAAVQMRGLYVTRRDYWLLPASYTVARVLAMILTVKPAPYGPFSSTVAIQGLGMVIVSATMFLLITAIDRGAIKERELERSEERYRVLAAATHDMVYEWNVATDTVEYTDAIRTVFGFSEADLLRDRFWWLSRIHPGDRGAYDAAIATLFASPAGHLSGIRYRVKRPDGSATMVVENAVVQRDASGSVTRVIGSVRDITAEDRLEEQLRQVQKMEAVGQLAGGAAHDFNNLLTVIGGHVFMVEQEKDLPEGAKRHLEGITKAAERAGALTRQLLAFSRKQVLRPTVLNLNTVIGEVIRLIGPLVGDPVRVVTRLAPDLPPVKADPAQIEQVLINLAINARDAMPNGGTLTIATAVVGRDVRLSMQDTGAGMDAETLDHVFEPFFTTKAAGKGTGLGLATAYGIIRQSSGDITVESTPGTGTTFTIIRPATTVPIDAPVTPVRILDPRASGKMRRVLLVEDDDDVRGFAFEILKRAGFQIFEARHGVEGLEVAKRERYAIDLVISDVIMPEMGGREMVKELRRTRADLPVLFISGYADDALARRELGSSEAMLLEKPFSARSLHEALRRMGVTESAAAGAAAT